MAEANERIMSVAAPDVAAENLADDGPALPFAKDVLSPNPQTLFRPLRHGCSL